MTCPWAKEILSGLLANDLVGFHLKRYCTNFVASVERTLGAAVDYKSFTIQYDGRTILVRPFPISIDFSTIEKFAKKPIIRKRIKEVRSRIIQRAS